MSKISQFIASHKVALFLIWSCILIVVVSGSLYYAYPLDALARFAGQTLGSVIVSSIIYGLYWLIWLRPRKKASTRLWWVVFTFLFCVQSLGFVVTILKDSATQSVAPQMSSSE